MVTMASLGFVRLVTTVSIVSKVGTSALEPDVFIFHGMHSLSVSLLCIQQPANDLSPDSDLILPKHDHQQIPQKPLQTHYPSPSCIVATGGLHGDLEKTMQAFRLGGLIDGSNYWFGASTTVVQIGDVLKILYFLKMLKRKLLKMAGKLITLDGNHEIMNVEDDFRRFCVGPWRGFKKHADYGLERQMLTGNEGLDC
ncbi:hypothetical protein J1N35_038037 [Gossypium stocksii]|uniref:Calcineurin-like phosphoesterase domain-containing protein n=1 Tax=Gossypium stocksii TaxID=47602 RepID=A0A9D3ZMA2_9ROSI|nr:hypothetical protein J1N35_038037 [Gossypium stocksii]